MSLYTHQESNIRKTWFLFTIFLTVIIGIGWAFSRIYGNPAILVIVVFISFLMSFISYWYSDKIVLKISQAKEIQKKDAPELYNIVENLCITAGLPMPKLYLINQPAPNAFATGRDPKHAVVAVTEGLLKRLDRSELEGVLAHELSHVGNRDILLSTVVVVLVGSVALLSDFFLRSMFWGGLGGRSRDRGQAGAYMMLIGVALAILAPVATMLIQLAISRKREFLADASGALLTRYPEGLASALEKISKDPTPLKVANKATNHLWVSEPRLRSSSANASAGRQSFGGQASKKKKIRGWFMTHPPTEERIKRLRGMNV